MTYLPSPAGITPLAAPLTVNTKLSFDTGNAATDRMAELIVNFANIEYDQVRTVSVDVGVTVTANDISAPKAADLVPIYRPQQDPVDVYAIGMLLTCEFGEVALYLATEAGTADYFDPPDVGGVLPLPLIPGGWFLHLDDAEPETADWQGETGAVVHVGEILAASFAPSRITGYVFLKNRTVAP